jgi:cytochrome subunit of sulfide dehydrogenase
MMRTNTTAARAGAAIGAALLLALQALPARADQAADTERLRTRALAATCAHCHGTNGHAVAGQVMVKFAGLSERYILEQLTAFRTGQRSATIMHQITKGYSQEQLETLAKYFAAQK